jgi:hypothetical protein
MLLLRKPLDFSSKYPAPMSGGLSGFEMKYTRKRNSGTAEPGCKPEETISHGCSTPISQYGILMVVLWTG